MKESFKRLEDALSKKKICRTYNLDVHGKTKEEAKSLVQKFIVNHPGEYIIKIVHGYNDGNVLKTFFSNKNNIQSKRVVSISQDYNNSGITNINVKV